MFIDALSFKDPATTPKSLGSPKREECATHSSGEVTTHWCPASCACAPDISFSEPGARS